MRNITVRPLKCERSKGVLFICLSLYFPPCLHGSYKGASNWYKRRKPPAFLSRCVRYWRRATRASWLARADWHELTGWQVYLSVRLANRESQFALIVYWHAFPSRYRSGRQIVTWSKRSLVPISDPIDRFFWWKYGSDCNGSECWSKIIFLQNLLT